VIFMPDLGKNQLAAFACACLTVCYVAAACQGIDGIVFSSVVAAVAALGGAASALAYRNHQDGLAQ